MDYNGSRKATCFYGPHYNYKQKIYLDFKTFCKEMTLNLYFPPNSAHLPDTIHSLIFGRVWAFFLHSTYREDFETECVRLARNLISSGWSWEDLSSYFNDAEARGHIFVKQLMVFKLPFHLHGIQWQVITWAYKLSGLAENQENCNFIVHSSTMLTTQHPQLGLCYYSWGYSRRKPIIFTCYKSQQLKYFDFDCSTRTLCCNFFFNWQRDAD